MNIPADALSARVHHVCPESVDALLVRVEVSEGVDETLLAPSQKIGETVSFLLGEASVLSVCLGVLQI